jgi:hypothetical protein
VQVWISSHSSLALVALVDPRPYQRNQRRFLNVCVPFTLRSCDGSDSSDGATRSIPSLPSLSFEVFALRRLPLSCTHTRRALDFGGAGTPSPPFLAILVVSRGRGGVSPLFGLHACTLCMLVLCEIRGVFRDLLARILGGFPPDPAIYQCFSRSVPCGRRWSGLV